MSIDILHVDVVTDDDDKTLLMHTSMSSSDRCSNADRLRYWSLEKRGLSYFAQ